MGSVEATYTVAGRNPIPSLRISFAWTFVGNAVYAMCQWGMISVLAKLGSAAGVGQFALGLATTAPLFMLTNLALRSVQATDARCEFDFASYFTLRSIATVLALISTLIIVTVIGSGRQTSLVILFVGGAKAVECFSDVIFGLLQKNERLDQVAVSMMLKGGLSFVVFGATFFYSRSVVAASLSLGIAWLLVFLLYDLRLARKLQTLSGRFFSDDATRLTQLAKLAFPLGVVTALSSFNFNIPRYAIQHFRGSSELGIFSALGYLVVVMTLVVNALAQSAAVRLSKYYASGHAREFKGLLFRMAAICLLAAIFGMGVCKVIGPAILRLLYGREYADHVALLQIFIATSGISAVAAVLGCGMTAARRFRAQVPVLAATLGSCAILVWALTPRFGMCGAAAAMLVSACVQSLGGYLVVRSALRQPRSAEPGVSEAMMRAESLAMADEYARD
jgi:O-antigen/teichoic acid export membrane protein